jgi:hypothetical protein
MATVDKNFRIKNGLVVEGTTATVNGNSVVTDADDSDILSEGSTNLFYTDDRVKDVLTGSTQTNISITEVDGALVITAENGVDDSTTDDLDEGTANLYFTDQRALDATDEAYDPIGSASTAESNANTFTNNLIGDATVDGTSGNTVTARISTAVSNLVDSAPGTLDTLNELAAALNDDAAFATTVSTSIGEKVAKAGDTMTGELALPSILLNAVAKSVAASGVVATAGAATAISFAKASYRSAEFLVKASHGTHTEISKVLLTLDSSDNIAITEYGIVSTNGSLITITADISGTDVRLRTTTANNDTTVTVAGTLLI